MKPSPAYVPGQRWISEGEPELGVGEVEAVDDRTVSVAFGGAGERRRYAREGAPLRRVAFRVGDTLQDATGGTWTVQAVTERDGRLHYACGDRELCESELGLAPPPGGPRERLLGGRFDASADFDLRFAALKHQYQRRKSPVRGFRGARIDLLPHQLGLAAEVASRLAPRVLLADEVGLGKTIEAGLILQRLLQTGRARRVLILVPESLLHQWFVELLRRFSLWFALYDEARCRALEAATPGCNPFLDDQLLLCDPDLLLRHPGRLDQALAAGWDLLVVDEAHHLAWSPEAASPAYEAVARLGRATPGLLLLTATPEQLGLPGHFARLRLLDPDRYGDLEAFRRESEGYLEVARLAGKLETGEALPPGEAGALAAVLGRSRPELEARLAEGDSAREALLDDLVDRHGPGRVMFRNTRASVGGFPARRARLHPLDGDPAVRADLVKEARADFAGEAAAGPDLARDPRVRWLAELLRDAEVGKVLLICRTRRKAEAVEAALRTHLRVKAGLFHEGLTLVQRDRAAAWFAEPDGARLLLCSEIGSEGRNFQFAHHLVLFDLPLDPGLLEQRIGRLDRIGQTAEIQVHAPFVAGSPQEVLARWYHEGLDAFATTVAGARELGDRFGGELVRVALGDGDLEDLVHRTREARQALAAQLEAGRDRLLERNAFRPRAAEALITEIRRQEASPALDTFLLAVLERHFVEVEELAPRTYQLGSAGVLVESFPGLPADGLTVTFDRARALAREELQFLTWDHPLVSGALDLVLGAEAGTCAFARWPDPKGRGLYLEALFLLEAPAPPGLHLDRFLPPTPLRVLVDHQGADLTESLPHQGLRRVLQEGGGQGLPAQEALRATLLPRLLREAEARARGRVPALLAQARSALEAQLGAERARLRDLQRVNPAVGPEEAAALARLQEALAGHLAGATLRLEALRLIQRGA